MSNATKKTDPSLLSHASYLRTVTSPDLAAIWLRCRGSEPLPEPPSQAELHTEELLGIYNFKLNENAVTSLGQAQHW